MNLLSKEIKELKELCYVLEVCMKVCGEKPSNCFFNLKK